jgi:hypothetical protein
MQNAPLRRIIEHAIEHRVRHHDSVEPTVRHAVYGE